MTSCVHIFRLMFGFLRHNSRINIFTISIYPEKLSFLHSRVEEMLMCNVCGFDVILTVHRR